MKTLIVTGLVAGLLAGIVRAGNEDVGEIGVGDTSARVREVLGEPSGYLKMGAIEMFMYDRGKIEVRDGQVARVSLMSPEEAARLKDMAEQERVLRDAQQRERQAALHVEGQQLKTQKLADADFLAKPGTAQAEYWKTFKRTYPDVSVDEPLSVALAKQTDEQERQRQTQRLDEMERRVAEAEAKARAAEREAEAARNRVSSTVYASPFISTPSYYEVPAGMTYYQPTVVRTVYAPSMVMAPSCNRVIMPCNRPIYPVHPVVYPRGHSYVAPMHSQLAPMCGTGNSISYSRFGQRSSMSLHVGF